MLKVLKFDNAKGLLANFKKLKVLKFSKAIDLPIFTIPQWKESFPNICGLHLLLFFWLKWAGYLAVAGLNLLAQLSDRRSPYGV